MTPQRELEIDKAALAFAIQLGVSNPNEQADMLARVKEVKTREQYDYLLSELLVEVSDE